MNAVLNFEMAQAVKDLGVVFGHKWDGEAQVAGYLKALSDLAAADVVAACDDLAKTEKFMPRPAKIRLRVEALRRKATPTARSWAIPETTVDPDSGKVVRAYRCRECWDTGWQLVVGIVRDGLDAMEAAKYRGARRCGCGRLAPPKERVFHGQGEQWDGEA